MDLRYETKDELREFHKQRIAFIIMDGNIQYIKNSEISHWEYCESRGISKEEFNELIRGYYYNGELIFYKNDFIYDDNVIKIAMMYLKMIMNDCELKEVKVYFGLDKTRRVNGLMPGDYFYGEVSLM